MNALLKRILYADNKFRKICRRIFKPIIELVFYDLIYKFRKLDKILLLQTPEHNNLGDHAIALGERKWLEDNFPNTLIVEFSYGDIRFRFNAIKKIVKKTDLIILPGGGNFGDLYLFEEIERRKIVKTFKSNRIIIMPQSVNYSITTNGQKQLWRTKRIFDMHSRLTIICRDHLSYDFVKSEFKNNEVILCPDIVHYLHNYVEVYDSRFGVLVSYRNDKEKEIDSEFSDKIIALIQKNGKEVFFQDTVISENVFKENRSQKIKEILKIFAKSEIVITDRFHGVVFSVIVGTPCIVFKSKDHKILEGIRWYNNNSNVQYVENNDYSGFLNAYKLFTENMLKSNFELKSEIDSRLRLLVKEINEK